MAYRMDYSSNCAQCKYRRFSRRRFCLTVFFFLLFLSLLAEFWSEGREVLRRFLIPGDPELTLQAAEVFAQELGNGIPLRQAAQTFYRTIVSHGPVF